MVLVVAFQFLVLEGWKSKASLRLELQAPMARVTVLVGPAGEMEAGAATAHPGSSCSNSRKPHNAHARSAHR
jgi:hypothetical protein